MSETTETIAELRSMLEAKRDRIAEQLSEIERAIDGLRLASKHTQVTRSSTSGPGRKGKVLPQIRAIVAQANGVFSIHDIHDTYSKLHPDEKLKMKTLSSALARMGRDGDLDIVSAGGGQKAATYRRPSPAPNSEAANHKADRPASIPSVADTVAQASDLY